MSCWIKYEYDNEVYECQKFCTSKIPDFVKLGSNWHKSHLSIVARKYFHKEGYYILMSENYGKGIHGWMWIKKGDFIIKKNDGLRVVLENNFNRRFKKI